MKLNTSQKMRQSFVTIDPDADFLCDILLFHVWSQHLAKDSGPCPDGHAEDVHPSFHVDLTLQSKFTLTFFMFALSSPGGLISPPSDQNVQNTTTPSSDLCQTHPHKPALTLCKRVIRPGRPQPEMSDGGEAIMM